MKLEHYPTEKLKKEILEIIGKYLDLGKYRIFFFGSRVGKNKSDEHSDIDIGIEGLEEISYKTISDIKEDIDNLPVLYKIEVVDFKNISSDFREVALQHTEAIMV